MQDALRTYLELAMGLTEASRKKVRKAVKEAVGKGNATADQVRTMTSDLLATNSANREALSKLVKFEVDRALGVVGLATAEEVAQLTTRVRDLERALREAEMRAATTPSAPAAATATKKAVASAPAKKTTAKKTTAKKTTAKKTTAKKTTAKTAPAKTAPAKTAAAKKAAAKKATPTKSTATKSTATKTAAARKAAPARTTARTGTSARKAQP